MPATTYAVQVEPHAGEQVRWKLSFNKFTIEDAIDQDEGFDAETLDDITEELKAAFPANGLFRHQIVIDRGNSEVAVLDVASIIIENEADCETVIKEGTDIEHFKSALSTTHDLDIMVGLIKRAHNLGVEDGTYWKKRYAPSYWTHIQDEDGNDYYGSKQYGRDSRACIRAIQVRMAKQGVFLNRRDWRAEVNLSKARGVITRFAREEANPSTSSKAKVIYAYDFWKMYMILRPLVAKPEDPWKPEMNMWGPYYGATVGGRMTQITRTAALLEQMGRMPEARQDPEYIQLIMKAHKAKGLLDRWKNYKNVGYGSAGFEPFIEWMEKEYTILNALGSDTED